MADLAVRSQDVWGDGRFTAFVQDLLEAGVMVDAASWLIEASRVAEYPSAWGRAADFSSWEPIEAELPPTLPIGATALPRFTPDKLGGLLTLRSSAQGFLPEQVRLEQLAALLAAGYGVVANGSQTQGEQARRSVPSAGAFYPLQLHVILMRPVESFAPGAYRVTYDATGAVGLQFSGASGLSVVRALNQPFRLRHAAGVVVISTRFAAGTLKYRNRVYPFSLIEAGCVLQNLSLASAEVGLGWRSIGGFQEEALASAALLDEDERPLIAGVFGVPDVAQRSELEVDFVWSDKVPGLPFQLAGARLLDEGKAHQSFCWGRDKNPAIAYDKAVAEAVERLAYRTVKEPCIRAAISDLDCAVDPRKVIAYSERQYRSPAFAFKPFSETRTCQWVAACDLATGAKTYVLAEIVLHPSCFDAEYLQAAYTRVSSSGCASGVSLQSAQTAALFELVERDAFMRHWLAQVPGKGILVESLPSDLLERVAALREGGCDVSLQWLNHGVCAAVLVMVQHHGLHFTTVGAAAAAAPIDAVRSALSEVETATFARLAGLRPKVIAPRAVRVPLDHAELYAQRRYYRRADALRPLNATVDLEDLPQMGSGMLVDRIVAHGRQVVMVDLSLENAPLTIEGASIKTVRMIVPGLIPLTFGHGNLPLGMDAHGLMAARFPHPFP